MLTQFESNFMESVKYHLSNIDKSTEDANKNLDRIATALESIAASLKERG
jgi:hypothetical protein